MITCLLESIAHYQTQRYKAIRVQCGIPGVPTGGYGIAAKGEDSKHFITQFGSVPEEEKWGREKYLRYMRVVIEKNRERFGPDLKVLHDLHHRLLPREAAAFGKEIE